MTALFNGQSLRQIESVFSEDLSFRDFLLGEFLARGTCDKTPVDKYDFD
jgi:hypothetical protein